MTPNEIAVICAACFAIGFIGGFACGFRIAAMIFTGVQRVRGARLRVVAENGKLREDAA